MIDEMTANKHDTRFNKEEEEKDEEGWRKCRRELLRGGGNILLYIHAASGE
jgi:hypothetical protein